MYLLTGHMIAGTINVDSSLPIIDDLFLLIILPPLDNELDVKYSVISGYLFLFSSHSSTTINLSTLHTNFVKNCWE